MITKMVKLLRDLLARLMRKRNSLAWKIAKANGRVIYSETSMAVYKKKHEPMS